MTLSGLSAIDSLSIRFYPYCVINPTKGHFIGKVDPNTPASTAGLKASDRIIEVNGNNVVNESHKQVRQSLLDLVVVSQFFLTSRSLCLTFRLSNELNRYLTRPNYWCSIPKLMNIIANAVFKSTDIKVMSSTSKHRPHREPQVNHRTMTTTTTGCNYVTDLG